MLKGKLSITASLLYLTGFISIQLHSLEYGITDLEILSSFYFVVGFLFIATLLPAGIFVLATELFILAGQKNTIPYRKIIQSKLIVILSGTFLLLTLIILFRYSQTYKPWERFFFFCTIAQPKEFVYTNYWVFNFLFIIGYSLIVADRRLNIVTKEIEDYSFSDSKIESLSKYLLRNRSQSFILTVLIIFSIPYTIVFGSSIYPAINPSLGGGAPLPIEIERKNGKIERLLLIARRTSAIYGISIPGNAVLYQEYFNNPSVQFMLKENHPLSRAIIYNKVIQISRSEISAIRFKFPKRYRYQEHYYKKKPRIENQLWNRLKASFIPNGA